VILGDVDVAAFFDRADGEDPPGDAAIHVDDPAA
jgi:hypothetical protein